MLLWYIPTRVPLRYVTVVYPPGCLSGVLLWYTHQGASGCVKGRTIPTRVPLGCIIGELYPPGCLSGV